MFRLRLKAEVQWRFISVQAVIFGKQERELDFLHGKYLPVNPHQGAQWIKEAFVHWTQHLLTKSLLSCLLTYTNRFSGWLEGLEMDSAFFFLTRKSCMLRWKLTGKTTQKYVLFFCFVFSGKSKREHNFTHSRSSVYNSGCHRSLRLNLFLCVYVYNNLTTLVMLYILLNQGTDFFVCPLLLMLRRSWL